MGAKENASRALVQGLSGRWGGAGRYQLVNFFVTLHESNVGDRLRDFWAT